MDLQRFKANLALRLFAWRYIPVIGFCAPIIEEMNAKRCAFAFPLDGVPATTWAACILARWRPAPIW